MLPKLEESVEFAENPESRCPCVLLLDTSGSMNGEPIRALNEGLAAFRNELVKDPLASRRVEIAIVTFGQEVKVVGDFVTADEFKPPILEAAGLTPMGSGIQRALDLIESRKSEYKANGVSYYRPWVFMITDGQPEGEAENIISEAARRVERDEKANRVAFFAVGVEGANMSKLSEIVKRTPVKLGGLNFVEMFVWLSRSTQQVVHNEVDDQVALPPAGWMAV